MPNWLSAADEYRRDVGILPHGLSESHPCDEFVRIEGSAPEAHAAPKTDLAQRARAGYCPRGTRATLIAKPPMYRLEERNWLKGCGLSLREAHEPWASSRLAARQYARDFGQPSNVVSAGSPLKCTRPEILGQRDPHCGSPASSWYCVGSEH